MITYNFDSVVSVFQLFLQVVIEYAVTYYHIYV